MTPEEIALAFSFPEGLDRIERHDRVSDDSMSGLSPFDDEAHDAPRRDIVSRLSAHAFEEEEDRAIGAVLGLVVGDALGAPLEFAPLRYGSRELTGFTPHVWQKEGYNRFALEPGQWTDDTSMALCLADSLLVRVGLDARDLRLRFLNAPVSIPITSAAMRWTRLPWRCTASGPPGRSRRQC